MEEAIAAMLSGEDLQRLIPESKLILHSDLDNYERVEAIFPPAELPNVCFLLLEGAHTPDGVSGHWVCLIDRPRDIVFFDPYGASPEEAYQYIKGAFREGTHMVDLLRGARKPVLYDPTRYQKKHASVATCGRWCVLRAALQDLSPREFNRVVVSLCRVLRMSPDQMVTFVTEAFLSAP